MNSSSDLMTLLSTPFEIMALHRASTEMARIRLQPWPVRLKCTKFGLPMELCGNSSKLLLDGPYGTEANEPEPDSQIVSRQAATNSGPLVHLVRNRNRGSRDGQS